jgi:uncharacterized membrane protein YhiD involved in acid resistance
MVSIRETVQPLFDTTVYNRLFRQGPIGRKYGWHFSLFTALTTTVYMLIMMQILKRHVEYRKRRLKEEYKIRFIYELNFTEMDPKQFEKYIRANRHIKNQEWPGPKETMWKTSYRNINRHVNDLKNKYEQLEKLESNIQELKKNKQ